MLGSVGVPELVIPAVIPGLWLVPVAAAAWVVVTLNRVRHDQQAIRAAVESIERRLGT